MLHYRNEMMFITDGLNSTSILYGMMGMELNDYAQIMYLPPTFLILFFAHSLPIGLISIYILACPPLGFVSTELFASSTSEASFHPYVILFCTAISPRVRPAPLLEEVVVAEHS